MSGGQKGRTGRDGKISVEFKEVEDTGVVEVLVTDAATLGAAEAAVVTVDTVVGGGEESLAESADFGAGLRIEAGAAW